MLLPTVVGPERGGTVWRTNHELNTPLHLAAAASGANNDGGDQALGSAGSAVVGSAVARACEIINLLLECGAELEAVNFQGRTPLHVASETAHGKRVCLALMARGADMDKLDSEGWTPRGLAEFLNHTQTVDSMVDSLLSKKGKGASAREFLPAPSYRSSFFVQASKDLNTHCANLADSDFRKATYAENDKLMRGLMTEAKFSSHLNSHGPQQTAFDYDRNREHFTGTAATAAYGQTSSQRPATQSSLVRTSSAAMTATATMGRSKSFSRESSVSPLGPPLTSASLERMDRDNGNSSSERDRRGTAGLMVTRPVTSQSTAFRSGSGGGGGDFGGVGKGALIDEALIEQLKVESANHWRQPLNQYTDVLARGTGVEATASKDVRRAVENLERDFAVVGLTRDVPSFAVLLSLKMNWPLTAVCLYSAHVNGNRTSADMLPSATVRHLRASVVKEDLAVYQAAEALHAKRVKEAGKAYEERLARFNSDAFKSECTDLRRKRAEAKRKMGKTPERTKEC
mmetsp:Transcript_8164/g.13767  ORF Transcript_8164/g.13767 Transcript_8164/m.13767 type:complete len:515 (+) Transcript_8164:20-1564(+)